MRLANLWGNIEPVDKKRFLFAVLWVLTFLLALYFRSSGLFRGLGDQINNFHPDEPKQILALFNFLNGDYVRYYGDLFYDGYPYGLNHLDEYLLRPMLAFHSAEIPEPSTLYYYARLLRVAYGMTTVVIIYVLVAGLVQNKNIALTAMFLYAIAPLSTAVTHFATGDIGVDLFTALCFLFLFFSCTRKHIMTWLFASGAAVGAAFSAKYNGLLVGMVPAAVVLLEYHDLRDSRFFLRKCLVLAAGVLIGILCFTPNLLLDFKTTISNIVANFQFIKNYRVPPEIFAKPWHEKALLGLRDNSLYIISSFGLVSFVAYLAGLSLSVLQTPSSRKYRSNFDRPRFNLVLSIALFPILTLLIALSGKYAVQPFHFSFLQLPIIVVIAWLFSCFSIPRNTLLYCFGLVIFALIFLESGMKTWKENFFWRLEDNVFYEQNLPGSLYDRDAFYTTETGPIRSLYLEEKDASIFKNASIAAIGPNSSFWNNIGVAPLPQVPNPIGKNWIFLNGPTFPRNDKVLFLHGESHGKRVKRYLVIPEENKWPTIGIRSGSFPTTVSVKFGGVKATVALDAHQQKTISVEPRSWKYSDSTIQGKGVNIVPLEVSVPHDDLWLTLLSTQNEIDNFELFGGGRETLPPHTLTISDDNKLEYFNALQKIRYLDHIPMQIVWHKWRVPLWEVPLPAGRYTLICDIEGLEDNSAVTIEFEDAKGGGGIKDKGTFQIQKGIQRIEFNFSKPFVPYQGKFVVTGVIGTSKILSLKLLPNFVQLYDDFVQWQTEGIIPPWNT